MLCNRLATVCAAYEQAEDSIRQQSMRILSDGSGAAAQPASSRSGFNPALNPELARIHQQPQQQPQQQQQQQGAAATKQQRAEQQAQAAMQAVRQAVIQGALESIGAVNHFVL